MALIGAVLLMPLVGCVERPAPPSAAVDVAASDRAPASRKVPPAPRVKPPRPPALPVAETAATAEAPAGSTGGPASEGPVGPERLVGLDERQTAGLLGQPAETGEIPPAKYWQYTTQSCVLRVFFFMDMTTQDFRALSYELTTSSDDAPDVHQRCFADLLAQAWHADSVH